MYDNDDENEGGGKDYDDVEIIQIKGTGHNVGGNLLTAAQNIFKDLKSQQYWRGTTEES